MLGLRDNNANDVASRLSFASSVMLYSIMYIYRMYIYRTCPVGQ